MTKRKITIIWYGDGPRPTDAAEREVTAEIYGPFAVVRPGIWRSWMVYHVATGRSLPKDWNRVGKARKVALLLAKQPGWDLLTVEEFLPRAAILKAQVQAAVDQVESKMTCRRCLSLVAAMEQVARDLDHEGYTSREMHSLEASLVLDAIADWKLNGLEHAAFWRRIARCFWPGDHP